MPTTLTETIAHREAALKRRIRKLQALDRGSARLTYPQLAGKVGVNRTTIALWMTGQRAISPDLMDRIAAAVATE